jgi:hypothetical protein
MYGAKIRGLIVVQQCDASWLQTLIHLFMRTNVEQDNGIFKFYVDNPYISCYRKSTLARKFASKRMVMQRITKFSSHEQQQPFLKLICKPTVRADSFLEMFFECSVTLNRLHRYRSFMKSSTVLKGPVRLTPFLASSAALLIRAAAVSLGSPHSSTSRSIRRPSTEALIITLRYACAESKPSCLALAVNFLRMVGSRGMWMVDVSLIDYRIPKRYNYVNAKNHA